MKKHHSRLRQARLAQELTQRELGRRAGIPQQLVCAFETGRLKPGLEIQQRLAEALGIPKDFLFARDGDPEA
jgi:transcriptional regulator with XRE-family HTH domain